MTAVSTPYGVLAFGSVDDAFDDVLFRDWNVQACINVAEELDLCPRVACQSYKQGVRDDDDTEDILRLLPDTLAIISRHHTLGQAVFVHCLEGKSRSVCVVLAYLSSRCGMTIDEALKRVTIANTKIDVYPKYLQQLRAWESAEGSSR
jgi:protein-tyrosine phosphatase